MRLGSGDMVAVFAKAEEMLESGRVFPREALGDALLEVFPKLDAENLAGHAEELGHVLKAAVSVGRAMVHSTVR